MPKSLSEDAVVLLKEHGLLYISLGWLPCCLEAQHRPHQYPCSHPHIGLGLHPAAHSDMGVKARSSFDRVLTSLSLRSTELL